MPTLLTTDSIAQSERLDWWCDRVKDLFDADYRIESNRLDPFHIEVALGRAEPLMLLKIAGGAHHALGRSSPGSGSILVHLQVEGHCTVRAEGKETPLGPGNLCFFPIRETTDLHFHTAYKHVCAVLPEATVASGFADWRRYAAMRIPSTAGVAGVFADYLRSLASHPDVLAQPGTSCLPDLTVGFFAATLHSLNGTERVACPGLAAFHRERVKHFARAHLCDPALSVSFVARHVGLSASYIHRLFRNEPLSLMQWIMKERLERCHAELRRGYVRSICDLAFSFGFSDHAHFTRSFRRQFGMPPKDARRH